MEGEFELIVLYTENFPPGISGASRFVENKHYVIINARLSEEIQKQALAIESCRKITD